MPSISKSLISNSDMHKFRYDGPVTPPMDNVMECSDRSIFHRCPVPYIGNTSVDGLQQFDLKGLVPQFRVFINNV